MITCNPRFGLQEFSEMEQHPDVIELGDGDEWDNEK